MTRGRFSILVCELLTDEGYRVSASPTLLGPQAVKDLAPDVIVLDLRFGAAETMGLDYLAMVQGDSDVGQLPFILCTAATAKVRDSVIAGQLAALGVPVIAKPFDLDDLIVTIEAQFTKPWGSTSALRQPSGR